MLVSIPGGGGRYEINGMMMLIGIFELNPLKETNLGVNRALFDP